jgi:hypothetical protein
MKAVSAPLQTSRIFPPISAELYTLEFPVSSVTPDQRLGRAIISLSQKRFSRIELWRGWRLDAAGKVGRLLLLQRMAIESEMAGQIKRADFFWCEAHVQLRELSTQNEVWSTLLQTLPEAQHTSLQSAPERLFYAIARELFLETHHAFFCGLASTLDVPPADHRSYAHLDYMRDMIDLTDLSKAEQGELLAIATLKQIGAYQEVLRWKRAEQLSAVLLRRFPDLTSSQAAYANLIFIKTISNLKNDSSEARSLRDAKKLQRGIDRLKKLRRDYPHNMVMLELIGHMLYLRAIKLANGRHPAQALADVQAALTYAPDLTEALEARDKLEVMMQDLRVKLSEAAAKIGEQPKAILSLKGLRMKREASQGFRLMDAFKHSEEARLVSEDAQAAQARRTWEEIGLGPLERFDLRPLGLYNALQTIRQDHPAVDSDLPAAWQRLASDDPELSELDSSLVCAYLARRLFKQKDELKPESILGGMRSAGEPPMLMPSSPPRRLKSEPFSHWLFSHQNLWLKLQFVACIVLLTIACGLAVREYFNRSSRAVAYHEIYLAKDAQDFQRMIEEAEAFLSSPIFGADPREDEVKALYSEALVRWVSSQIPTPEQTDFHARRYRALVLGIPEGAQP